MREEKKKTCTSKYFFSTFLLRECKRENIDVGKKVEREREGEWRKGEGGGEEK